MRSVLSLLLLALSTSTFVDAAPKGPAPPSCNLDNPFLGRHQFANSRYADLLEATVASFTAKGDKLNAARTRTVQGVSSFFWLDTTAAVGPLSKQLDDALKTQKKAKKEVIFPLVVYNLPDRDCSAKASAGELFLSQDGETKYREYIDAIVNILTKKEYSKLQFAVVVEPDGLANGVTNLNVEKCANARDAYVRGVAYAVQKLGVLENAALYIDAAHSNWLGWPGNLEPTAKLMKEVIYIANGNSTTNQKAKIRGFATNISNYNAYNATTPDIIYGAGPDNPNWSELRYVTALAPYLEAEGLPAHFIIDQGRSGQQSIREVGGHWCNIDDSGFGIRPTTETGSCIVDSIVWVKPGGESDGTSDETAARYDENCRSPDAKIPAPEAGGWFNEFVEMLVKNANPPLKPTYK